MVEGLGAVYNMTEWNMPNEYVIQKTCDDVFDETGKRNPWNYNQWVVRMAVLLGLFPAAYILSLAVRCKEISRYRHQVDLYNQRCDTLLPITYQSRNIYLELALWVVALLLTYGGGIVETSSQGGNI